MTVKRPSLLMLMAGAAALSTVAHAVSASGPDQEKQESKASPSRLGSAIQSEMRQKKQTARERERALDLREQAIKASEKRLKNDVESQQQQQAKTDAPAAAAAKGEKAEEVDEEAQTLDQLARIYQSMKPKQAAPVFEQLDIDVQLAVARRMRERSTAQILAAMTPEGAARLSMALAGKKRAPKRPGFEPAG